MASKSIFVTGAASGIGAATALHFLHRGWRVGLADRQASPMRTLAAEIGPEAEVFEVDVTNSAHVAAALEQFCASTGRLDALLNSVGILDMHRFDDTPLERLHAIIDVNIKGIVNCVYARCPI